MAALKNFSSWVSKLSQIRVKVFFWLDSAFLHDASVRGQSHVCILLQAWDLATAQCQHTLKHHKGKVQAVAWNPAEASVLLSGGFDKVVAMVRPTLTPCLRRKFQSRFLRKHMALTVAVPFHQWLHDKTERLCISQPNTLLR